jgi:hypothetical protein
MDNNVENTKVFENTNVFLNGLYGILDALGVRYPASLFYHSKRIREIYVKCLSWNAFVLLVNLIIWWYSASFRFYHTAFVWCAWILPMWGLSEFVNKRERDKLMHTLCQNKYKKESQQENDWKRVIADFVYEFAIISIMCGVLSVANFLSSSLYIIGYSWIYSYNLMSYRMIYKNMRFHERLEFFETYWLYFLFFGLPFSVIYVAFPLELSYPLFYSAMLVFAPNTLHVYPRKPLSWFLPFKIFFVPEYLVNQLSLSFSGDTLNKGKKEWWRGKGKETLIN